jgi:hypothetical protein
MGAFNFFAHYSFSCQLSAISFQPSNRQQIRNEWYFSSLEWDEEQRYE